VQVLIHSRWLFYVVVSVCWAAASNLQAQPAGAPEHKLKAAFVYNFAKLAEWPEEAFTSQKAPLTIGILGTDHLGRMLEELVKNRRIEGRKIQVMRYKRLEDVGLCQVLFISDSEAERVQNIVRVLADRPILTVSDLPGFARQGGIIGLYQENDEMRFEVNRSAAKRANVRLSSKLLSLAKLIDADQASGGKR
jgi:hypothetical protein